MNKLVSFACTAAIAPSIFAQTEGWLPNSDLPRVASDGGSGAGTAIGALTTWDPDGDGPLGRCLVVAGGLNMQVANAASVAYFDGDWHGLGAALSSSGGIYNCIAYREPNSQYEQIFATTGQGGLFRFTNGSWVQLNNCTSGKAMIVADLDGDGPQPPKLLVGGFCGVTVWDGISSTQLTACSSC